MVVFPQQLHDCGVLKKAPVSCSWPCYAHASRHIVTDSQIARISGSGEMRPTSRYNTGLGLMKTEVNRKGYPAISARCISNTSTSINRYRCVTLLDISVIVRDINAWQCWISIYLKPPLPLAGCMLTSREPGAVRDPYIAFQFFTSSF
jgi:hypothetical protein